MRSQDTESVTLHSGTSSCCPWGENPCPWEEMRCSGDIVGGACSSGEVSTKALRRRRGNLGDLRGGDVTMPRGRGNF